VSAIHACKLNLSIEEQQILLALTLVKIPLKRIEFLEKDSTTSLYRALSSPLVGTGTAMVSKLPYPPLEGALSSQSVGTGANVLVKPPYPLFEGFSYFSRTYSQRIFANSKDGWPLFQLTAPDVQTEAYCCGLLEDELSYVRIQRMLNDRFGDSSELLFDQDLNMKGLIPSNLDYIVMFARRSILTERYVVTDTHLRSDLTSLDLPNRDLESFIEINGDSFVSELQYEHYCLLSVSIQKKELQKLGVDTSSLRDHFGASGVSTDIAKFSQLLSKLFTSRISRDIAKFSQLLSKLFTQKKTDIAIFSTTSDQKPATPWLGAWDYFYRVFPSERKDKGVIAYKRTKGYETSPFVPFNVNQTHLMRHCREFFSGLWHREDALKLVQKSILDVLHTLEFYDCDVGNDDLRKDLLDVRDDLNGIGVLRQSFSEGNFDEVLYRVRDSNHWKFNLDKGLPDLECQLRCEGGGSDSNASEFTTDELLTFCRKRNYVSNVSEFRRKRLFSSGSRTSLITLSYKEPLLDSSQTLKLHLTSELDSCETVTYMTEPLTCSPNTIHMVDVGQRRGKIATLKFRSQSEILEDPDRDQDDSRYYLRGSDYFFVGLSWWQNSLAGTGRREQSKVRRVRASNRHSTLGFLCCRFSVRFRTDCYPLT
jgi:hypothetical protein